VDNKKKPRITRSIRRNSSKPQQKIILNFESESQIFFGVVKEKNANVYKTKEEEK